MKNLYPLKTKPNRCWRCYLGGKLIDVMREEGNPTDGYFPEDWLASTVVAVNPDREGKPEFEGLSVAILADGSERYLRDLIEENPEAYLGKNHVEKFGTNLGVLAKFLDSAEKLPVQCHPDKKAAKDFFKSDYGKTEAWFILDGRTIDGEEPYILMGFKEGVTKEMWRDLFEKQDIKGMDNCMHKIRVKPGDVFIIEGGCPHAIGSGCLLLEIQEPTPPYRSAYKDICFESEAQFHEFDENPTYVPFSFLLFIPNLKEDTYWGIGENRFNKPNDKQLHERLRAKYRFLRILGY